MRALSINRLSQAEELETSRRNPSSGKWDDLPFDILSIILFTTQDERRAHHAPWYYTKTVLQPTLFAATLVNKSWYSTAIAILYRDVLIASYQALSVFTHTLHNREELRPLIYSFFFSRAYYGNREALSLLPTSRGLEVVYDMCPKLHSELVELSFPPNAKHLHRKRLWDLNRSTLTRLEIWRINISLNTLFTGERELSFPALEHLIIRGYLSSSGEGGGFKWPSMPRLRRLCLFKCCFMDKLISFPNSSKLLALEIIEGNYFVPTNLWSEIASIGKSLELLTFMTVWFRNGPRHEELQALSSLVVLRVSSAFLWVLLDQHPEPFTLPPRLVHLEIHHSRSGPTAPRLSDLQQRIMHLVEMKKSERGCVRLKTVHFRVRPNQEGQRQMSFPGEEDAAGITFSQQETHVKESGI